MSDDEDYLYDDSDSGNDSVPGSDTDDDDGIGMEMGLGGIDDEAGPSGLTGDKSGEEEFYYEVLTTEQIVEHMVDSIKEVNNVIQIPTTTVRILLNHFKWDKEKLMEKFFSDEQEELFTAAKVVSPFNKSTTASAAAKVTSLGKKEPPTSDCEICFLTLPTSMMMGLECGHLFCTSCWVEYLTTKIMDEGISQSIECPGNCEILVDDQTVMKLVKESKVRLKYQHLITNSFVQV